MIISFRLSLRTQKNFTLHNFRDFCTGKTEPGLGHINKTDQALDFGTQVFRRSDRLKLFWYAND